jgi:hypothetical protein
MMDRLAFIIKTAKVAAAAPLVALPIAASASPEEEIDRLISELRVAAQESAPDGFEIKAVNIHRHSYGFIAEDGDKRAMRWAGHDWTVT